MFLLQKSYHDATVACGGALYPVHKIVLSTCSEYFEEMFDSIMDKHPIIVLKDIKGEVFEALLKYMYIGEVNVIQELLSELISAAECLKIKGLGVPDEDPTPPKSGGNKVSSPQKPSEPSGGAAKRRHDQISDSNSASSVSGGSNPNKFPRFDGTSSRTSTLSSNSSSGSGVSRSHGDNLDEGAREKPKAGGEKRKSLESEKRPPVTDEDGCSQVIASLFLCFYLLLDSICLA